MLEESLPVKSRRGRSFLAAAALVVASASAGKAQAAFCDGDEAQLCPSSTCTITGVKEVGHLCTLDFSGVNLTVTGTLKAENPGGWFTLRAQTLTLNSGTLNVRGNTSTYGGSLTVDVVGAFVMQGAGAKVDAGAAPGGGGITINAGSMNLAQGTIESDGSAGADCGYGGAITLSAPNGSVVVDVIVSSIAPSSNDCGGGPIAVTGGSIEVRDRIDNSGGDVGGETITLLAKSGDVVVTSTGLIKSNGSGTSDPDTGGSGGDVTLQSERAGVIVDGEVSATGAGPDGSGGYFSIDTAEDATITGDVTVEGKGPFSSGGVIDIRARTGVTTIASTSVLDATGRDPAGEIYLIGITGNVAGQLVARGLSETDGGVIELWQCSVTVSGKLDAGASGGGGAGITKIAAGAITLSSTAEFLATPCMFGSNCHQLVVKSGAPNIHPNATIDPSPPVQSLEPNLMVCCGNGAVDGAAEACDDGNTFYCDGCRPDCTVENPACPDPGGLCTIDHCHEITGCSIELVECPADGIACTNDCSPALGCVPTPNDAGCDDGNTCTTDTCDPPNGDPATGCVATSVPNGQACKDNNPCTTGDTCQAGVCNGGGPSCCDDGDPCTIDGCTQSNGCTNVESSALCPSCAGLPAGTPCTDADQGTIGDTCNGAGVCVGGAGPNCEDNNPCTYDFRWPWNGRGCGHQINPQACEDSCFRMPDGLICGSFENPCLVGTCQSDECVAQAWPCGDEDPANGEEVCLTSQTTMDPGCTATFPLSNCVQDVCGDGAIGATEDCDDGNTSAGDCCSPFCQYEPSGSQCGDEPNPCTDDECDGAGECAHTNNSAPCSDGSFCTIGDQCASGSCSPGGPLTCNDADPCTADSCGPASGCVYGPIAGCTDEDGDGKPAGADECTTVAFTEPPSQPPNQNPSKLRVALKDLDAGSGAHRLSASGLFNPATDTPPIDPAVRGVHVLVTDAIAVVYEVSVPGGSPGSAACGESDGWSVKSAGSKTKWRYRNLSGALPPACEPGSAQGIDKIQIQDLRATNKAALAFRVGASDTTFAHVPAVPLTRLQFTLALGAQPSAGVAGPEAIVGQCAEFHVEGMPVASRPPAPFCKTSPSSGAASTISCQGP